MNGEQQQQQLPAPALLASGGVLSLRLETAPDGTVLVVLRAQSQVVGVDAPMTAENVDVLIKGLRELRGKMNGGLIVAKGLGGLNGNGN